VGLGTPPRSARPALKGLPRKRAPTAKGNFLKEVSLEPFKNFNTFKRPLTAIFKFFPLVASFQQLKGKRLH
jgi:hypothetical protein